MAEEKTCPHCGKKLRRDNTRGACSACLASPGTRPSQARAEPKPEPAGEPAEVMATFRTVAAALGFEPDVLLAEAAQSWLDGVRDAVNTANSAVDEN